MNTKLLSGFFAFFLFTAVACKSQTSLSPKVFSDSLTSKNAVLVDVRTPQEYGREHLKGALLMDYLGDNFNEKLSTLDKEKPIYVYCQSGGRSSNAQEQLFKMGYQKVYNLEGGIMAWQKAGLPVEK